MAKLNKKLQGEVAKAETLSFEPVAPGIYPLKLVNVDTDKSGPAGPYWSWEFKISDSLGNEIGVGRKLWRNTSLSQPGMLREVYDVFGFTYDSDTDEMLTHECRALISQGVIEKGNRKGEKGNDIVRLMSLDIDDDDATDDGFGDTGDTDDGFGDDLD